MEAVFLSFDTVVTGGIDIPPSAAITGTVPSVEIGSVLAVITVEDIAGNAVATADGGEEVRVVKADAFMGIEGTAVIENNGRHLQNKQVPAIFSVSHCVSVDDVA